MLLNKWLSKLVKSISFPHGTPRLLAHHGYWLFDILSADSVSADSALSHQFAATKIERDNENHAHEVSFRPPLEFFEAKRF
jgi:hypothetical protein